MSRSADDTAFVHTAVECVKMNRCCNRIDLVK